MLNAALRHELNRANGDTADARNELQDIQEILKVK